MVVTERVVTVNATDVEFRAFRQATENALSAIMKYLLK